MTCTGPVRPPRVTRCADPLRRPLRTRPGADVLWTSCVRGKGSPQPFYEHYGFVDTGELKWDETVLRLDLRDEETR